MREYFSLCSTSAKMYGVKGRFQSNNDNSEMEIHREYGEGK